LLGEGWATIATILTPGPALSRAEYTVHPPRTSHRHTTGLTRREVLQVGYSALAGIGLSSLLAHQSKAAGTGRDRQPTRRARTVVFVYLTGAPSHIDTFDPKPEAPAEVRGSFQTVPTTAPVSDSASTSPRGGPRPSSCCHPHDDPG
jgi:Protein of unknown function (DUF1501).